MIKPVFPKPIFISAPWDCKLPNLEPWTKPVMEFTAPSTTGIMSLGKRVTASAKPSNGDLSWLTNSDASTEVAEVSFDQTPCWIQIDLGEEKLIEHIWLWHGEGSVARRQTPEVFEDVIVQISCVVSFASGVTTLFNSDLEGSCGQGKGRDPTYVETNHGRGIPAGGKRARYVRVWGGKAYSGGPCRFTEVTVWGR